MSDKQKGLINAVQKVFPHAEHRFCVRHLYQNFHKVHKGEQLKNDLWSIARSTNDIAYQKNMDQIKSHSEAAYKWVEKQAPRTWIKAFFNPFPKCDILLNNMSEVFNSYILEARELPVVSALDNMHIKLTNRIVSKQRESDKWTGRLCPKIQKKLDKFVEWAANCMVQEAGKGVFQVKSFNNTYLVDLNMNSCDCKRWELSGIPCHHVVACARHERIEPESLVHPCYTVESYKKAYAYNIMPLRDKGHWEKMHGIDVYPPLYTKVMGRPKKTRKKDPEEKKDKNGGIKLTKAGSTMHCSICKAPNHNKKGHHKHVNDIQNEQAAKQVEEDFDDPGIVANIMPHTVRPFLDPTQTPDSMVFMMQEQERFVYPRVRDFGPLPESNFIANAREEIPPPRMTTAMTRGRIRRGGTAASRARGGNAASGHNARGGGASNVARGGGHNARGGASNVAGGGGHNTSAGGGHNARGGGGHNARGGNIARGGGGHNARGGGNVARGGGGHNATGANVARGARAAAPGFYNLRFGDDGSSRTWTEAANFMQAEEEVLITQNAPDDEWPHDFLSQ
ncbi:uncharacterized protein [Triticum aestivum]|nr:uncharacterized protein LOC123124475 [Triticum aestivum]